MNADALRTAIRSRLADLGISPHHVAALTRIPYQTVRDYLGTPGRPPSDLASRRVLLLAAAAGLDVQVRPAAGYTPPTAPPRGRRKKPSEISEV